MSRIEEAWKIQRSIEKGEPQPTVRASDPSQDELPEELKDVHDVLDRGRKVLSQLEHNTGEDELLPCPLCGSIPELYDLAGWEIWCKCGLSLIQDSPEKEPLIKRWNTRTKQDK